MILNLVQSNFHDEADWQAMLNKNEELRFLAIVHDSARDLFMLFFKAIVRIDPAPAGDMILGQRYDWLVEKLALMEELRYYTMTDPNLSAEATVEILRGRPQRFREKVNA